MTLDFESLTSASSADVFARARLDLASVVAALDLGPEPVMRDCPHCGAASRATAITCGSCRSKITPTESEPA